MKTLTLTLAATLMSATAAFAMGDIAEFDQNGDQFATMEELQAARPGLTRSEFREIDTNSDNRISATEIAMSRAQSILGRHEGTSGSLNIAGVDTNNDNFISPDELFSAYPGMTTSDWNEIDTNDDRRISSSEFQKGNDVIARYTTGMNNAVLSLNEIDTNANMFADFDEVMAVYPGLSEADFRDLDANDDRRLNFVELYRGQTVLARN